LAWSWRGQAPVEGRWLDSVTGLHGVRVDIAMMRTPDGHGRLELTKFHTPAVSADRDSYRLCYLRGPDGIIVALAEQLS
jgi:hypothetical protein